MPIKAHKQHGLEILTAGEPSHRPSLLFIHGAFSGAWIWAEHFLPFFAENGWRCVAVSLRGHGKSEGAEALDSFGVADYVADIAAAAAGLAGPPVVIGHSMGGAVAQHYARWHEAAGLALLSSVSPAGLAGPFFDMALRRPNLMAALGRIQSSAMGESDFRAIKNGLFSADAPDKLVTWSLHRFQRESLRANIELMTPQWFWLVGRPNLPALVAGGPEDGFVPASELRLSAVFWNAELQILDGVPHAMMLDPTWRRPAETVLAWLTRTFDRAGPAQS